MALPLETSQIQDDWARRAIERIGLQFPPSPGTIQALTLATGFSALSAPDAPSYRKDPAGIVHLQGRVTNANLINNDTFTTMLTMPTGARAAPLPGQTTINHVFAAAMHKNPGNVCGWVLTDETGIVQVLCPGANISAGGWISLDGVSYLAA